MAVTQTQFERIPQHLRSLANWVVWRLEQRLDKKGNLTWAKVPYNARTGGPGKSNKPETWSTFAQALAAFEHGHNGARYSGIGFCLSGDIVGVDLDGCRKPDGTLEDWAQHIVDALDSYTEITISDEGIRVIATGSLPKDGTEFGFKDRPHHGLGLYRAGGARFLVMTGHQISGNGAIAERTAELQAIHAQYFPPEAKPKPKPQPAASSSNGSTGALTDDQIIEKARKFNPMFPKLWDGLCQYPADYPSQSEADMALCCILAFWTDRDASRINSLFRQSRLFRETGKGKDYLQNTIANAIDCTSSGYQPRKPKQSKPQAETPPPPPFTAQVILDDIPANFGSLNSLAVLRGLIRFKDAEARNDKIVLLTDENIEIVFHRSADLNNFARARDRFSERADIFLPTPPHRQVKSLWEPFPALVYRIIKAKGNRRLEEPMKVVIRDCMQTMWRRAGQPVAQNNADFIHYIRLCLSARRDNEKIAIPPPNVFVFNDKVGSCVVIHAPTFRAWISTSQFENHRYSEEEIRTGMLLLGAEYQKNFTRRDKGDHETVSVWITPLDVILQEDTDEEERT